MWPCRCRSPTPIAGLLLLLTIFWLWKGRAMTTTNPAPTPEQFQALVDAATSAASAATEMAKSDSGLAAAQSDDKAKHDAYDGRKQALIDAFNQLGYTQQAQRLQAELDEWRQARST
jgi:hypothetical protein